MHRFMHRLKALENTGIPQFDNFFAVWIFEVLSFHKELFSLHNNISPSKYTQPYMTISASFLAPIL